MKQQPADGSSIICVVHLVDLAASDGAQVVLVVHLPPCGRWPAEGEAPLQQRRPPARRAAGVSARVGADGSYEYVTGNLHVDLLCLSVVTVVITMLCEQKIGRKFNALS